MKTYRIALEGYHPTRAVQELGVRLPLYVGATGKAILAFLSQAAREDLVGTLELVPYTGKTIVDRHKPRAEVDRIRGLGFSESDGERVPGMSGVAAPILGRDGAAVGWLSVIGVCARLTDEVWAATGPLVQAAAQQISESLGFKLGRGPPRSANESAAGADEKVGSSCAR